LAQAWTWAIGMAIFSNAMHTLGLLGAPRRTPLGEAPYVPEEWGGRLAQVSIGGTILLVSLIIYLIVMIRTATGPKVDVTEVPEVPVAESLRSPQFTPAWLDRFGPWLIGAGLLIAIAYGPQLVSQIGGSAFNAPGFAP
jgi:cytochrome c oxidase subunit 1